MARPKKPVDEVLLKKLASIFCTTEQMAHMLNVSKDTLERRYAATIKEARSTGKMSLLRKQFEVAMAGNVGMLIWMGKQHLEQSDRMDQTSTEHKTISINIDGQDKNL
jgi:hypothetical protein